MNLFRAGGMVSETNFKFFIQFCIYTVFFCAFVLITTAYFLHQGGEVSTNAAFAARTAANAFTKDGLARPTWIVMLAL